MARFNAKYSARDLRTIAVTLLEERPNMGWDHAVATGLKYMLDKGWLTAEWQARRALEALSEPVVSVDATIEKARRMRLKIV